MGGRSPLRERALQEGDTPSLPDPGVLGGAGFTLTAVFFCRGQQHPLLTRADLGKCWPRMPLGSGPGWEADNTSSVAGEMCDTHGASATATHHLRQSPACGRHRPCHPAAEDAGSTCRLLGTKGHRRDLLPSLAALTQGSWRGSAPTAATPPPWEGPPRPPCLQKMTKGDLLCKATPKPSPWESRPMVPLTRGKKIALGSNSEPRVLDQYDSFKAAAWTSSNTFGFVHVYLIKNTLMPS